MFQAFRIEFLVLIYYTFNGNLRHLFNIFRETSVNTNMARGNASTCVRQTDSATEALTLLSYCKYFYFLLDSSVQDVKALDRLH